MFNPVGQVHLQDPGQPFPDHYLESGLGRNKTPLLQPALQARGPSFSAGLHAHQLYPRGFGSKESQARRVHPRGLRLYVRQFFDFSAQFLRMPEGFVERRSLQIPRSMYLDVAGVVAGEQVYEMGITAFRDAQRNGR